MFGLGWPEIVVILLVVGLVFGPRMLPELGSALGKTLRGFKEEIRGEEDSSPD
ncbi:MAG: twin-arginine translocase TatA/TatE family subunit [Microcystaceae cyanobacterium]